MSRETVARGAAMGPVGSHPTAEIPKQTLPSKASWQAQLHTRAQEGQLSIQNSR